METTSVLERAGWRSGLWLCAISLCLSLLPMQSAQAREVTVQVDAKSGPWISKANKETRYGFGREKPPTVVTGFVNDADAMIEIYPVEGATTVVDGQAVGPEGIAGEAVNDMPGRKKKYYPSLYAPKVLYPTNRHALLAVFLDAENKIMGRPFAVGEGVRVRIPDQAAGLALGFNDIEFADNEGSLSVIVNLPED